MIPCRRPVAPPQRKGDFPLLLITGARKQPYYASSYRQIETLHSVHPEPRAEMAPATAARLGLEDGCPVTIETERGQARFRLKVAQMRDDVISVEYGWWYPEMPASEPDLGGAWISNANALTSADIETSDLLIGTWTYNGLPCRVLPVEEKMELSHER